jgi:hypothetical protein
MSNSQKTISGLISTQLPDFIRADNPKFQRFVELYYSWLEKNNPAGIDSTAGNTVFHAMQIGDYRDIDETPDEFVRYFKQEILPHVPEGASLDLRKLLKSAREFYSKKGSDESLRWLFKVLFDENIEVNYPKEQILKVSDGKWKIPKAFRITASETNKNVDVNLLEKRLVTGLTSGATCFIESANRSIDVTSGREVIEIYISNIRRFFENGEFISVNYVDETGTNRTFVEKIIGTISNIRIDSNIKTDPQQKRRGLLYNVGDPVVITGGLALTDEAQDGIAIVGNVSVGSIEAVTTVFPGYGYLQYPPNTEVIVLRSVSDDPNANASTDLRVQAINATSNLSNSQRTFLESITYDMTVIEYVGDTAINTANIIPFTTNNRNIVLNLTETNSTTVYNNDEEVWADGTNFFTANFRGKIATSNSSGFGQGGAPFTGSLHIYDVANTGALSTILTGKSIFTKNTSKNLVFNSIVSNGVPANADSKMAQCFTFRTANTGGIALVSVVNGGYGFRSEPTLDIASHYDTQISENYNYITERENKRAYWQTFSDLGQIAHVYIENPGSGYANGDTIRFVGRGYGGNANVVVNGTGSIVSVNIIDRGEGHTVRPNCVITSANGSGAVLTGYLFGDGFQSTIDTSAIGRIRDLRLIYRGFDYVATPNVSLKVVDAVILPILETQNFIEQEYIYQGSSLETSTFRANIKFYNATTGVLRLYNYSGTLNPAVTLKSANGVQCNVNTAARVPAPAQYPALAIANGLNNPMYYGDGRARAIASFANGLIQFDGFFLNSDGFLSSDKVLQANSIYHNFSYIIQSEKSLSEFENPLKNIIHPAGLEVISKTVIKSSVSGDSENFANVNLIMPINSSSTVTVSNSYANVVTGSNTAFLVPAYKANVGDLFMIVDTSYPLRTQSKVISNVVSNTSLQIFGDFIYIGQGKLTTNSGNSVVQVVGTTNALSQFIAANDQIRTNVRNMLLSGTVNVSGNTITGNGTQFVGNVFTGSEVTVNNEVRTVQTVTNATSLVVNTAFTYAATNKYINANSIIVKTVSAISGNNLVMNSAIFANATNLVYQVVPNYASAGYNYKIVTLTSE